MEPQKFRYWSNTWEQMIFRSPPENMAGSHPHLVRVSEEELQDRSFRLKHRLMIASGITDINGNEIYEGDIIEVYTSRYGNSRAGGSISVNAYVEHVTDLGFMVDAIQRFKLYQGLDCEVIGNFFDQPDWIEQLGGYKQLRERWSR